MAEWWSIEVLHGEFSAFQWQVAHDSELIEAALTNGAFDGTWHADRWGVAFEVCFETTEQWEAFRALPIVRAALDGVPDPVNGLIIRALLQYYSYYGNDFTVECPTGSGHQMTLYQVAEELARRLGSIFLQDKDGRRPVYGGTRKFQEDAHWRDYISFFEYFHGDNGAGLGASHQTGWTGIIARAMHLFATTTAEQVLAIGKAAGVTEVAEKAKSAQAGSGFRP